MWTPADGLVNRNISSTNNQCSILLIFFHNAVFHRMTSPIHWILEIKFKIKDSEFFLIKPSQIYGVLNHLVTPYPIINYLLVGNRNYYFFIPKWFVPLDFPNYCFQKHWYLTSIINSIYLMLSFLISTQNKLLSTRQCSGS